jgi:TonB family protein
MIALIAKATILLAVAFAGAHSLRNRSAALRHAIWTIALLAILLLPATKLVTPSWMIVAPVAAPMATTTVVVAASAQPVAAAPLPWLAILYGAGVLLAATRFLAGAARVSWMIRKATPTALGAGYGVRVVASADAPVPLAWGIFRRAILLPTAALEWPADRLRAVLLHEAMHHQRRDLLTQAVAQAACCLYWFHPLAWVALARQRREREMACDDAVLQHGVTPHDYAASLVDVVRATRMQWSDAPAMADASSLESRVRAVLDQSADRRPLTGRSVAAVVAATVAVLLPVASVSLYAQTGGGTIAGVVKDPTGARVPRAQVTARNLDAGNEETATAGPTGEYRITGVPAGRYSVEIATPGFVLYKMETTVVTGAVARIDANLTVGQVRETVSVVGRRSTPAVQAAPRTPERIRVGGNVQPVRLIRQPRPDYPAELQAAGVEGTVVMRAVISKDGSVLSPRVISSSDQRLSQAALDAVAKWVYQPALLNGEPIETLTTISVEFHLDQ